jgi:hypothetical protein
MRWEQPHGVPERLKLPGPVMGRSARLQKNGRWRPLGKECYESIAREPPFFINPPRPMRHGNLKHRLCEIDGDGRMLHVDSSCLWP